MVSKFVSEFTRISICLIIVVLKTNVHCTDMIFGEFTDANNKDNLTNHDHEHNEDFDDGLSLNEIFGIGISIGVILLLFSITVFIIYGHSQRKLVNNEVRIRSIRNGIVSVSDKRRESSRDFINEEEPPSYATAVELDVPNPNTGSGNHFWI